MKKYQIAYSNTAKKALRSIFDFVKNRGSLHQARYVKNTILTSINKALSTYPDKHPINRRYKEYSGYARSFAVWEYNVIYEVDQSKAQVLVLHILHGARENIADDA